MVLKTLRTCLKEIIKRDVIEVRKWNWKSSLSRIINAKMSLNMLIIG